MLAKPLLFFRLIFKNFKRKHKNGLARMKLAGILRHISTNLAKKFEQKKTGFMRKSCLNIFRETDAILLILNFLKIVHRVSKED